MVGTKRAVATAHVDEAELAEKERSKKQREGRILRLAKSQLRFATADVIESRPKDARWYCLQVASGHDFSVEKLLSDCGVEVLSPREKYLAVRRKQRVQCERPCFAGYLLARFVPTAEAFSGLRLQKNVIGFVGGRDGYIVVRDNDVKRFQLLKAGDVARMAVDKAIVDGTKALINIGPFAGYSCQVLAVKWSREARARVQIDVGGNPFEIDSMPLAFLQKL